MMDFAYFRPTTLSALLELVQQEGFVAYGGGTDLLLRIREGSAKVKALVDVKQIVELGQITVDAGGNIEIGSAVTMAQLSSHPLIQRYVVALYEGAKIMGCREIQNRATIGGNLANASPSADTAVPLVVYDAELTIVGLKREYSVPLREFFTGPGRTILQKGEIIRKIKISSENVGGCSCCYLRESRIKGMDLATVSVAVWYKPDAQLRYRVAAGAVLPTPARIGRVEEFLNSVKSIDEQTLQQVRVLFASCVNPRPGSLRGSPLEKKYVGSNLLARGIRAVTGEMPAGTR